MVTLHPSPTRRRILSKRELSDASKAKAELSGRYFVRCERGELAPFIPRRRIEVLQRLAGNQIQAIGIGRKIVAGKLTDQIAVRVYVTQKLPKTLLGRTARIDKEIAGIPTDVIEAMPAFFAMPPLGCTIRRTKRARPLQPGASIGNVAVDGGTLACGCLSTRPGESSLRLILGNNHVLANFGAAQVGSSILQPSVRDGGRQNDQVATLLRFAPVIPGSAAANRVDAAVAALSPAVAVEPGICSVGTVNGIVAATEGLRVHKHGRTSGHSIGVIDDPACDVLLPLSRSDLTHVARFVDQIRIQAATPNTLFAQAGDSGALIVSKARNRAVGLLFACPDNGSFAYANPILDVLSTLEIALG